LAKLFSPFPASSSPNPVTIQHQPTADLKNAIPEAKLDTNGQQTSKAVGASHPLEIHNDSNEFSDAGSMAGTLASQGEFTYSCISILPSLCDLVSNLFLFFSSCFIHLSSVNIAKFKTPRRWQPCMAD